MRYIRPSLFFALLFLALAACQGPQTLSGAAAIALQDVPTPSGFSLSAKHPRPHFVVAGHEYRAGTAHLWGPGNHESITTYMHQALPDFGWQLSNDIWAKDSARLSFSVTTAPQGAYNSTERATLAIKLWSAR